MTQQHPLSQTPYLPLQQFPRSGIVGLFGGTFDPIHCGHTTLADALIDEIQLQRVVFLPNHIPPHRPQPIASAQQRLTMVKLAIADNPLFQVDDRELQRHSPSYTIDTLEELQQSNKSNTIAFIIGQDSLLSLPSWHRWQELLDYCHLIVCDRPGYQQQPLSATLTAWLAEHQTTELIDLHTHRSGNIYFASTPLLTISATEIRYRLQQKLDCHCLLNQRVLAYIQQENLYR